MPHVARDLIVGSDQATLVLKLGQSFDPGRQILALEGSMMYLQFLDQLKDSPTLTVDDILASMIHSRDDVLKLMLAVKLTVYDGELGAEAHLLLIKLKEMVQTWPVKESDRQDFQKGLDELYWLCESCCDSYAEDLAKPLERAISIACGAMTSEAPAIA